MTSLADVARLAGVSPATVSRVLSGSAHPIKLATRARVNEAARDLSFVPNKLARALATSRTNTFGVIVHDIADPYFAEVVRGLEDGVREEGFQLFVCSSDREPARELGYVEALIAYRVDALVFAGGGLKDRDYQMLLTEKLDRYRQAKGAVVTLAPNSYGAPSVTADNVAGAAKMAKYLVDLGHRRIGFVSGPPDVETSGHRLEGFHQGMATSGIRWDPQLAVPGSFEAHGGRRAAAELLDRDPDITAVVASSDVDAMGVLQELRARSIDVPGDVSLASFGGSRLATIVDPPLTTIEARMHDVGTLGARMALRVSRGERVRSVVLDTELVVRGSTAPPR